jgi:hypothetical protein
MKGVLCQLTKYFGVDIIVKSVNWTEAGVTQQEFLDWHKRHIMIDEKRESNEPPKGWMYRIEISNRPTQYAMNIEEAWEKMAKRGVGDTWFVYDRNGRIPEEFITY